MSENTPIDRHSYTIVLEIRTTAPLTHGMANEGNEQVLLTRSAMVKGPDGRMRRIEVPAVSGAAMKSTLREHAHREAYDLAGIGHGQVNKDVFRLLGKGGKNDSGGQTVSMDQARMLRELFPLLSVFGSMDGGQPITSKITVSDVLPWCTELVEAGLLARQVTPIRVTRNGEPVEQAAIPVYPDTEPFPASLCRDVVTYYRHDMLQSRLAPMIATQDATAIEDKRAANAGKTAVKKADRRDANESMPHSMQCIIAGTPMVCVIRLTDATEIEFTCLLTALARWRASGAHLGGGQSKGHGACQVAVAGAIRSESVACAAPGGELVSADPAGAAYARYVAYMRDHADEVRRFAVQGAK